MQHDLCMLPWPLYFAITSEVNLCHDQLIYKAASHVNNNRIWLVFTVLCIFKSLNKLGVGLNGWSYNRRHACDIISRQFLHISTYFRICATILKEEQLYDEAYSTSLLLGTEHAFSFNFILCTYQCYPPLPPLRA